MRTTAHEGFYTPPPTKNYSLPTTSNPKLRTCLTDNFYKLPSGDSPYVRAKHVQLVDRNPGKAVSLFWAAINCGDRVDSALKDMAVVMKQLDRSDEAIEAIKSFRSLCPPQSQDSLDNVLVELYKRSGRIEEEIEILNHKLKRIEDGVTFGGKRSKIMRCQGKRVVVTVEQETARILGNLAWAYLQLGEYSIAEDKYREGLSLDPDKNMQCNLAYCFLQTHRIEEAKSLLDAVKSSSEGVYMDESYAKSYERALSKLTDMEQDTCDSTAKGPLTGTTHNCTYTQSRQGNAGNSFLRRMNSGRGNHENRSFSGTAECVHNDFSKPCTHPSVADSSPVILTQPRSPWRPDQRKKLWNGRVVGNSSRKLSFEQPNIDSHQAAWDYHISNRRSTFLEGRKCLDWRVKALEALPHSDIIRHHVVDGKSVISNGNPCLSLPNETESQKESDHAYHAETDKNRQNSTMYQGPSAEPVMLSSFSKKSWADMVEEDELFARQETMNKENVNPNSGCPALCKMT